MKFRDFETEAKIEIHEMLAKRGECNRKLEFILAELIEKLPGLRFGQILYNFEFITKPNTTDGAAKLFDPFNEEPLITFNRVCGVLKRWGYEDILERVNN